MHFNTLSQGLILGLLASAPLAAAYASDIEGSTDVEKRYVGSLSGNAARVARAVIPEVERRHHSQGGSTTGQTSNAGTGGRSGSNRGGRNQKRHHSQGGGSGNRKEKSKPKDNADSAPANTGNSTAPAEKRAQLWQRHHSQGGTGATDTQGGTGATGTQGTGTGRGRGGRNRGPTARRQVQEKREEVEDLEARHHSAGGSGGSGATTGQANGSGGRSRRPQNNQKRQQAQSTGSTKSGGSSNQGTSTSSSAPSQLEGSTGGNDRRSEPIERRHHSAGTGKTSGSGRPSRGGSSQPNQARDDANLPEAEDLNKTSESFSPEDENENPEVEARSLDNPQDDFFDDDEDVETIEARSFLKGLEDKIAPVSNPSAGQAGSSD